MLMLSTILALKTPRSPTDLVVDKVSSHSGPPATPRTCGLHLEIKHHGGNNLL